MLAKPTGNPPAGAIAFKVTVPVATWSAETVAGLKASAVTAGGFIVRVALLLEPPEDAVIVALVVLATATVATWKVTLVVPEGTVAVAEKDR